MPLYERLLSVLKSSSSLNGIELPLKCLALYENYDQIVQSMMMLMKVQNLERRARELMQLAMLLHINT